VIRRLTAAIGRYPHTTALGEIDSPLLRLDFAEVAPISRAFAPMVREGRYDVSEMAIATFLQARAWGKPLVLLPVVLAARSQEAALLCRTDGPIQGPADLAGRRIGVRAYSQTTGMWLRGTLADAFRLAPEAMRWTTFEDAHVPEYRDPPWAERAPAGADMLAMLRDGTLDAAIFGNDTPADAGLRTVFRNPGGAGAGFEFMHGFVPVNHLVVVRAPLLAEMPALAAELVRLFRAAAPGRPATRRADLAAPLTLAAQYCLDQGLLPRPLTLAEIWEGLPAAVA
jgi:4,5-dihydroxyphthalate decarboxylase